MTIGRMFHWTAVVVLLLCGVFPLVAMWVWSEIFSTAYVIFEVALGAALIFGAFLEARYLTLNPA